MAFKVISLNNREYLRFCVFGMIYVLRKNALLHNCKLHEYTSNMRYIHSQSSDKPEACENHGLQNGLLHYVVVLVRIGDILENKKRKTQGAKHVFLDSEIPALPNGEIPWMATECFAQSKKRRRY